MVLNKFANTVYKLFLQVSYDCGRDDEKRLTSLQSQIQERLEFLNENDMDSYNDPQLLEYYELYSQVQQCVFDDHTDQYLLIASLIAIFSFLVYFRWRMLKKYNKKDNFAP